MRPERGGFSLDPPPVHPQPASLSMDDRFWTYAAARGAMGSSVQDRPRHRVRVREQALVSRFHRANTLASRETLVPPDSQRRVLGDGELEAARQGSIVAR